MNDNTLYSRHELSDLAEGTQKISEPDEPIKDFQTLTSPFARNSFRVKSVSIENALISHEIVSEGRDDTNAQDAVRSILDDS